MWEIPFDVAQIDWAGAVHGSVAAAVFVVAAFVAFAAVAFVVATGKM